MPLKLQGACMKNEGLISGAGNEFQGGHLTKSKVPAGKWKGVTVAVKIVEHSAETEGELLQLRESLLSSSIVHPNVVRLSNT